MLRKVFEEIRTAARRRALRDAAKLAEERAELAAELAPRGRLGEGLGRANIAHEIAVELRAMAESDR
jgi:hypothetical protein